MWYIHKFWRIRVALGTLKLTLNKLIFSRFVFLNYQPEILSVDQAYLHGMCFFPGNKKKQSFPKQGCIPGQRMYP